MLLKYWIHVGIFRGWRICAGEKGLLDGRLDGGAGEACLAHDAADGGIVEDGHDELAELDLDGQQRGLLLVGAAASLVGLGTLDGRHQRVGERRRGIRGGVFIRSSAGSGVGL